MNVFFDDYWISNVVPVGELWVGRRDILFAESRFMTDYHYMGPPGMIQVGIGSGLGQVDRSMGRVGISLMPGGWFGDQPYTMGCYFAGDILVRDRATIRGNLFIGKYMGGSLGVQAHLGQDRWSSRVKK